MTQELLLPPALAMAGYLWSRTPMLKQIRGVLHAVDDWPGLVVTPDRTGLCLAVNRVTLGHVRWDVRVHVSFEPEQRDRLVAEEMASFDSNSPDDQRVALDVRSSTDIDRAVWLLRLAYLNVGAKQTVWD